MKLTFHALLLTLLITLTTSCDTAKKVESFVNVDPDKEAGNTTEPQAIAYPFNKELTNLQGVKINVLIQGRDDTKVFITNTANNQNYIYPIANLSLEDQKFISDMPLTPAPATFTNQSAAKAVKAATPNAQPKPAPTKPEQSPLDNGNTLTSKNCNGFKIHSSKSINEKPCN